MATPSLIEKFRSCRIHIIGVGGIEGYTMARYWLAHGVRDIVLHDYADRDVLKKMFVALHQYLPLAERLHAIDTLLSSAVQLQLGSDYLRGIGSGDVICLSQNWFAYESNAPLRPLLGTPGRAVVSLLDLYFDAFPGKIIGVTGSNGKSTTVDLITKMLAAEHLRVFYGGNERTKPQGLLSIDQATVDDILMLEISNRQLKPGLAKSPNIAVITNVTPNHLAEHGSFESYAAAKQSLFALQNKGDYLVLNQDDPVSSGWAAPHDVFQTSISEQLEEGVCLAAGKITIRQAGQEIPLLAPEALPVRGKHFLSNVLLAIGAAWLGGARTEAIRSTLLDYHALPGRLELVGTHAGTRYYSDIKSTVPQATVAALSTFELDDRVMLICGGQSKGMSYDDLAQLIATRVAALILLPGTVRTELQAALSKLPQTVKVCLVDDMEAAWQEVQTRVAAADVVLLSPAGAGFSSRYLASGLSFRSRVAWLSHRDNTAKGIWHFHPLLPRRASGLPCLTLGEGQTPLLPVPTLAAQLNLTQLQLKREDQNPGGSHKDRSLAWRMSLAAGQRIGRVVIPSTGNAAISTLAYAKLAGIPAVVLVRPHIDQSKLATLQSLEHGHIILSTRTTELASYLADHHGFTNLRPSRDPLAPIGYQTIAYELALETPQTTDLFTYGTSGSSFVGIARGYAQLLDLELLEKMPALHIVGQAMNPDSTEPDIRRSMLWPEVQRWLTRSGGRLMEVEAEAIAAAGRLLEQEGIQTSWEGQATMAAVIAFSGQHAASRQVTAILTGKARPGLSIDPSHLPRLETPAEIDHWMQQTWSQPPMV